MSRVAFDCIGLWRALRHNSLAIAVATALLAPVPALADVSALPDTSKLATSAVVQKLRADAQKALSSGNVRLAGIYLKNAVSAQPGNSALRVELGKVLFQGGAVAEAEDQLRQAHRDGAPDLAVLPTLLQVMLVRGENQLLLDQFPDPPAGSTGGAAAEILKGRAFALQDMKQPAEALQAMDRSLALRRDVSGLLARGRLSLQQNDFATAERLADEAIQAGPDDAAAMLFKVEVLLTAKDNSAALNLADQAKAKFPANLSGRFLRIEAYLRLNQDSKAQAEVDAILAQRPTSPLAIYYGAVLMARKGDAKKAWGQAQTLPADFRDSDQAMAATVALMALRAGDIETGASILARMLNRDPDQLIARIVLATIRLQQNSVSGALTVLRPVLDSTDPRVIRLLVIIYTRMGRSRDSLDALKRLDASPATNASVKRSIALLELQQGDQDEAIKILASGAAKEPSNPVVVEPLINILVQKRRFGEALAAADRFGVDARQRVQSLVYRGGILMLQQDFAGARAALDKALALDPRSKAALYSRATLLQSQQKYDEAARDLTAILSLGAKEVPALLSLADIAGGQGDDQKARGLFLQAIALAPQNPTPRTAQVRYLASRRDTKAALAAANDCVRAQSSNADCVLYIGQIQSTLGQKKEAVISFRRYAALRPQDALAQLRLGGALSLAGDKTGAARAFDAAVELAPQAPDAKRAQIDFQLDQGNTSTAVNLARAFQVSYPGSAADLLLADTLLKAKHREDAVAVLEQSLSAKPDSSVLMRLAELVANDKKRAGQLMRDWLLRNPQDRNVRQQYAAFLMFQDDNVGAAFQYQTLLKQQPDNLVALNNLGWLIQRDDPKRALALVSRAAKLAPDSATIADTLGWLKLQQKDAQGGLTLLNRAHSLQPGDGQITYHLAVALDANGKRDAARALLKALLASGMNFRDKAGAMQLASAWR